MSRLAFVFHRPHRALAALATVLAAGGLTVASGADFTAQAANPSNTFTTGTLSISNSRAGSAILSATGLKPGDAPVSGTVDIANTGSLAGDFSLKRGAPVDSDGVHPLSGKLRVVVRDCGEFAGATAPNCGPADGTVVYDGMLADMDDAEALGEFADGEKHRFRFDTNLDASAGNEYQGDVSSVEFSWTAA
jgi:spore coat-associated protein N